MSGELEGLQERGGESADPMTSIVGCRAGRVTSLVLGRQATLARELMELNRKGERIHAVPK